MHDDAVKALKANGLTLMQGVRSESYAYRDGGKLTYFELRGEKFFAEGEVAHLPAVMGYSEEEIEAAFHYVHRYFDADENPADFISRMLHHLKNNRKESGC